MPNNLMFKARAHYEQTKEYRSVNKSCMQRLVILHA